MKTAKTFLLILCAMVAAAIAFLAVGPAITIMQYLFWPVAVYIAGALVYKLLREPEDDAQRKIKGAERELEETQRLLEEYRRKSVFRE